LGDNVKVPLTKGIMQTVTLGARGPSVSALGIGTWAWGDRLFWGYGKSFGEAEVAGAFQASLAAGITFFDTAEIYGFGVSEQLLGQFSQQTQQPVQIATKYFPLPWRWHRGAIAKALTASLDRLQMSHICLYQIHWPLEFWLKTPDFMEVLAAEVKQGRIQAVGVSNYSAKQMSLAHGCLAAKGIPLATNQVPYSLLNRAIEHNGTLEQARQLGVTILAYSPLAQGLLTGKYTPATLPDLQGARRLDPRFTPQGLKKLAPLISTLQEIGEKYDRTPAQVALNWLMAQGNVLPIAGAKNADQAQQNAGALGWSLSPEAVDRLGAISLNATV
jgi:aryl-alcohol dehydrogenase-like predicted oxidoreductase